MLLGYAVRGHVAETCGAIRGVAPLCLYERVAIQMWLVSLQQCDSVGIYDAIMQIE